MVLRKPSPISFPVNIMLCKLMSRLTLAAKNNTIVHAAKSLPNVQQDNNFDSISSFLEQLNISWEVSVGICTDGAPLMVCSFKGFVTLAKKKTIILYLLLFFAQRISSV